MEIDWPFGSIEPLSFIKDLVRKSTTKNAIQGCFVLLLLLHSFTP